MPMFYAAAVLIAVLVVLAVDLLLWLAEEE